MASQCYGLHIGILMTVIGDVKHIAVLLKNQVCRAPNILPLFAVVSTENNSPYRIFVELFLCVHYACRLLIIPASRRLFCSYNGSSAYNMCSYVVFARYM